MTNHKFHIPEANETVTGVAWRDFHHAAHSAVGHYLRKYKGQNASYLIDEGYVLAEKDDSIAVQEVTDDHNPTGIIVEVREGNPS